MDGKTGFYNLAGLDGFRSSHPIVSSGFGVKKECVIINDAEN